MHDVLIVGGGPAGLCAGLYAVRAGLSSVLVESEIAGGQAATTDLIHNYPGFPGGIGGPELTTLFEDQATELGLKLVYDRVTELSLLGDVKRAQLPKGALEARAVILCMGASRRRLGVPGEDALVGRGVSYCATCDGAFFAGRRVAVVGGGYSAVEDALYLAQKSDVLLIHRRDQLRAVGLEAERALSHPRIQPLWNQTVSAIESAEGGLRLRLMDILSGAESEQRLDGCFVAIGTHPNSELLRGQLPLDDEGYVLASEDTKTPIPGVFVAGDLRKKPLKQVVTAVSDGAVAATIAARHLMGS